MADLGAELRLVRLALAVHLRRFGFWPWLVLFAWCLYCAGQEPRLLRAFDIQLSWQGAWSGAAILLIALASAGSAGAEGEGASPILRRTVMQRAVVGLALTAAVAVGHVILAWFADSLGGQHLPLSAAALAAAGFFVAMAPAGVAATTLLPWWGRSRSSRIGVVVAVGFSLGASAVCFSDLGTIPIAASVLAAIGATCMSLSIASSAVLTTDPLTHANRHSR